MGGHHQGEAALLLETQQQVDDLAGGPRVDVPGRLVGEDDIRLADERPRDPHPLLLAARQFAGKVAQPGAEPEVIEQPFRALEDLRTGRVREERHGDVLHRGQGRDQVEELEHEADVFAPQVSPSVLGQVVRPLSAEAYLAFVRSIDEA